MLFNALLEDIFAEVRDEWQKKRWGIQLGHTKESTLSNLRFADDVLLLARSREDLRKMLRDFQKSKFLKKIEEEPLQVLSYKIILFKAHLIYHLVVLISKEPNMENLLLMLLILILMYLMTKILLLSYQMINQLELI